MKNLNKIGEELFNKIRGRFPEVTIGDEEGNVTNTPSDARFFDFDYNESGRDLGKVSVSVSEKDGLTIIYSKDFMQNEDETTQTNWYNFLKELRVFSKKRLLNFDVRDINKSNLNKRDYKFLATNLGDNTMTESKLYGTSRISYQNIDNARLVIKHTESVNQELAGGRTRSIGTIYVESADGERFKYPYRHLTGARAMARHVSEGGKPYDDFGGHITGLSEEMSNLRKFRNYMGRSSVMAESLSEYMDVVRERISTVKKTIESLQKPNYYAEAISSFVKPVFEDVPDDVKDNWVDQLTIRQFNEELQDVFPYIYRLVSEHKKAKTLGPVDIVAEADDPCWKDYKQVGMKEKNGKQVPNCVPEEEQLEQGFEEMMGQFAEEKECSDCGSIPCECSTNEAEPKSKTGYGNLYVKFAAKTTAGTSTGGAKPYLVAYAGFVQDPTDLKFADALRTYTALTSKDIIAKTIKKLMTEKVFVNADKIILYKEPGVVNKFPQLSEFFDWMSSYKGNKLGIENAPEREVDPDSKGSGKKRLPKGHFAANPKDYEVPEKKMTRYFTIDNARVMQFLRQQQPDFMQRFFRPAFKGFLMKDKDFQQFAKFLKSEKVVDNYGPTNINIDHEKSFSEDEQTSTNNTPLSEFILSYFDRENGQFPKGETAILTMVEKEYGDEYIDPAKHFIERVNQTFEQHQMNQQPIADETEYQRMRELAGLR